jgi:hypothetical protein
MTRGAALLVGLAMLSGCVGLFTVERQPTGDPGSSVRLWRPDAAVIDAWKADEPTELAASCEYWEARQARTKDATKGMTLYLSRRVSATCRAAQDRAHAIAQERRRQEAHERELDELAARELASGACAEENQKFFGDWALFIKDAMQLRFDAGGSAKFFSFIDHELGVIPESGASMQFAAGLGGELHLFAFARRPVELELFARGHGLASSASPWEDQIAYRCRFDGSCTLSQMGDPARPEYRASRVVLARSSEPIEVRLHGKGCVLLVGFYGS